METLEKNRPLDLEAQTRAFLSECEDIVYGFSRKMNVPIYNLSEDEQQEIVDRVNVHLEFEHSQSGVPKNIPIEATGTGLLFVCNESGSILGAEIISDGDVVHGSMSGVVALPVPTLECLVNSEDGVVSTHDQVFSPVVVLKDATYKTGLKRNGKYVAEHNLSQYKIGVAMAHPLKIRIVSQS